MTGVIKSNKSTISTTALNGHEGRSEWVEMSNTGTEDVYGRYDAVASSSDWDFKIIAGATKTLDKGCKNTISLATDSGTSVLTIEYI